MISGCVLLSHDSKMSKKIVFDILRVEQRAFSKLVVVLDDSEPLHERGRRRGYI